jgi:RNA-directed DNA polymerase
LAGVVSTAAEEADSPSAEAEGHFSAVSIPTDCAGVALINPILRGWVRYFAVGDASRCCGFVTDWVEKKVRRQRRRARKRRGFGWKRWRRQWLYKHLGLFKDYRVQRPREMPKALPA